MPILRLFASAREAAGTDRDQIPGSTVGEVLQEAGNRYGQSFIDVLGQCRVWCNGEPTDDDAVVRANDEIAVLPPVSGGAMASDDAS